MPAPTITTIQQSLSALQEGGGLHQQDFFNIAWGLAAQSDHDQFLLETDTINKNLAETLIVFRKRLSEAVANATSPTPLIQQALLHYIVNTDGQLPPPEEDNPFDVLDAVARYAESLGVMVRKQEDGTFFLCVDDQTAPCPALDALPDGREASPLREIGRLINRIRYGQDHVLPSYAFGFDENVDNHSLHNAMTLADCSHLAYYGPAYVKKQLKQWGYDAFQWIEDKKTDTQAFVAGKNNHLIVCFRGTSSGADALVDARMRKIRAYGRRGRVHRGFHGALSRVWRKLYTAVDDLGKDKKLYFSGHSLGAALAQLAAHRFALRNYQVAGAYVYGSPRIGNRAFMEAYNELLEDKTFLHINNSDIIAQIPPRILGFRHLGGSPRQFDREHAITLMPKSRSLIIGEEEEMDFEDLDEEQQEAIMQQMREAQRAVQEDARFVNRPATDLSGTPKSKGLFDNIRPLDDHSIDNYLYKFGQAVLDGEWARIRGEGLDG